MKELILAQVYRLERKLTTLERLAHVTLDAVTEAEDQLSALKAELGLDGQPELISEDAAPGAERPAARAAGAAAAEPARGAMLSCGRCGDYYHHGVTGCAGRCNKCMKQGAR
jgi:hypothetical protein